MPTVSCRHLQRRLLPALLLQRQGLWRQSHQMAMWLWTPALCSLLMALARTMQTGSQTSLLRGDLSWHDPPCHCRQSTASRQQYPCNHAGLLAAVHVSMMQLCTLSKHVRNRLLHCMS